MSEFTVVDCNGLNGSLSYGLGQHGGALLYRTGYLNLGDSITQANAHLWGNTTWRSYIDKTLKHQDEKWYMDARRADVVVAVPPCSGFSVITGKGANRGLGGSIIASIDHPSNDCMVSSARYAARHAPYIYAFESVTGAFRKGRELMQFVRSELERISGHEYSLTHWLHDGCTLGAPSSRQRYMFIAVRGGEPFAVTPWQDYAQTTITPLGDAIGDLVDTPVRAGDQPLAPLSASSEYSRALHRADKLVDGHTDKTTGAWYKLRKRLLEQAREAGPGWVPGTAVGPVMRMIYEQLGEDELRDVLGEKSAVRLIKSDFNTGPFTTRRETWEGLCALIAGDGPEGHIHPIHDRAFTLRETARVQGWPDDLRIEYDTAKYGKEQILAVWGKAVTAIVARHFGKEVRDFIMREHGSKDIGESIGDREWLIDHLEPSKNLRLKNRMVKNEYARQFEREVAALPHRPLPTAV